MTKQFFYTKVFELIFILIAVSSVTAIIQVYTGLPFDNTSLWWVIKFFVFCFLLLTFNFYNTKDQVILMRVITFYLALNILNIVWGGVLSEGYWDYKGLITNGFALLVPLFAYFGTNKELMQSMLANFFKFGLLVFITLLIFMPPVGYGYYLVPFTLVALFLPGLTSRWKLLIVFLICFVVISDISARSTVIKFVIPLLCCVMFYFRRLFTEKVLNVIRIILIIMPILFLTLAVTDTFNVFNIKSYISGSESSFTVNQYGELNEEDLLADTRTFLYVETLDTADFYNSWLFGRSPARGTMSDAFGDGDLNERGERLGNEVAILNIFTWTGLVGVIFYGLIFYQASFFAITRSNNYFCKILGIYIAFRWGYGWVEDFTIFSLTYVLLWLMIGMCYSKQFREMNDSEFTRWARGIFDSGYR